MFSMLNLANPWESGAKESTPSSPGYGIGVPMTYLAIVQDVCTVEIMNVEPLSDISDEIVYVALDAVFDRVQQRRPGVGGVQGQATEHGGIELYEFHCQSKKDIHPCTN